MAKILPPDRPAGFVERPALAALAATAAQRRLTLVVAEAGFGKSTLLASWWEAAPCAWYTVDQLDQDLATLGRRLGDALRLRVPELPADSTWLAEGAGGPEPEQHARADSLAARLAETLHPLLPADLLLVVDDIQELSPGSPSARLVEALCRHAPPRLHLVLSGRQRPPFPVERLRGQGQLLDIGGAQLAFSTAEVAELIETRLGASGAELATSVHRLTGGWPAGVVLAVEALRDAPAEARLEAVAGLERPGAPLFNYLAEEVFARLPPPVRHLMSRVALLDRFTPELCEALGIRGARALLAELAGRGLFVDSRQDGSLALRPLIREYALEHLPLERGTARRLRLEAGQWMEARGDPAGALRMLVSAGMPDRLRATLVAHGARLLAGGQVAAVLDACRAVPAGERDPTVEQLQGEAEQIQGDWEAALACFQRATAGRDVLPASLAWRIGVIHYLRGEPERALQVYASATDDEQCEPVDTALLLAWTSTAHWIRGEVEPCRTLATRALAAANASGDRRALAAAHTVMAMLAALDGDRRGNDAHYLLALRAAEEAPDVLQTVRIRTNRASHFLEEGSYAEALQELEVAVRLAELTSYASFLALSLSNRGEAKVRLGRIDEGLSDLEASRERYRQIGSDMIAYPLTIIGEVYRERGNLAQARAVFEEAAAVSEASGDVQGLVPALAGLATVLAVGDPEQARTVAGRAVALGAGLGYVTALLAQGWVAWAREDTAGAASAAAEAIEQARGRHDRAGLAEATVLAGAVAADPGTREARLREAVAIWREIGNPVAAARTELALASASVPGAVALRRDAERALEAHGLRPHPERGTAAGIATLATGSDPPALRIQSLGGFAVLRGGAPVPASEWQSRRARELLKLLVARRGRPATRGFLMETLWPGEDPDRIANRLSVALTTVRTVLDPERRLGDDIVVAGKEAVALDLNRVDVDLERFLTAASEGQALLRRGEQGAGLALLEAATRSYAGDFLEENSYDDWAVVAREEARSAYVAASRVLATHAAAGADPEAAVPHFLRILELDRYDEQANLGLVSALTAAGRHGEAHRHYLNYRRAMDELGVEPAPFPAAARAS